METCMLLNDGAGIGGLSIFCESKPLCAAGIVAAASSELHDRAKLQ